MPERKSASWTWQSSSVTPKIAAYEPVLSGKAAATLLSLPRAQQTQMMTLLTRLAARPNQLGDYATRSEEREVQHLRLANWRVFFWVDHAGRELRGVSLTKL